MSVADCVMSLSTEVSAWRRAVDAADAQAILELDRDLAAFWCPTCAAAFCRAHWATETFFDEAGPDYLMGTCPHGHRRMVVHDL